MMLLGWEVTTKTDDKRYLDIATGIFKGQEDSHSKSI